jgi:hypothetical protein
MINNAKEKAVAMMQLKADLCTSSLSRVQGDLRMCGKAARPLLLWLPIVSAGVIGLLVGAGGVIGLYLAATR